MNASEKFETSIPDSEKQLPKNPEKDFEIEDEQKFEQHRDKTLSDIESGALQTKEDGIARLDRALHSYDLPEKDVASIRRENQVDAKLKLNSDEVDEITKNATEQISQVGGSPKSEQEGNPDLKKFTKQYSGFWRSQLAEKIRDTRKKILEKKTSAQKQNSEHSADRTILQSEITATEQEFNKIRTELESREMELEEEKNRLISRITSLFGRNKEVSDDAIAKELESKSEKLQAFLEEKRKLISECGDVVIDESEIEKAREEIRQFYEEQKNIRDVFGSEKTRERDISSISKEKGVLFLHTLPVDSYGMGNTSENNPNVNTEKMTSADKTRMVLGIEPTISVSTISLRRENAEDKFQTMYPIGLVIGEGTALSAYGGDAGTYADNPFIRRSKYDRDLRSAVQENFGTNLDRAIKGEAGQAAMQTGWNEVVIENPKVSGIFLDLNRLQIGQDTTKAIDAMKQAFGMGKEFGLPVYGIRPNGEMTELSSEGLETTTQENILAYKCELGTEEKVEGVEKVLKTQEKPNIEIQRKLSEIQAQRNSKSDFIQNQKQRAIYSGKSEQCLSALEYENVAKYMEKTLNRLGDIGFDEILKVAQSEGVGERGLEKINSLFTGKTTSEIRSISESLVQKADLLKGLFENRK